jgi:protein-histidine pros-kinase
MNNTKYLNVQALKSHFDGDEEMIAELLEIFESTFGDILNDTKVAIEAESFNELEHSAHTLKGMIANFFAEELIDAAQKLEDMGRSSELINAETHLQVLISGIPVMIEEIRTI